MKWKSKQAKTIHREGEMGLECVKHHISNWQEYFEPVYEVGDWVVVLDSGSSINKVGEVRQITFVGSDIVDLDEKEARCLNIKRIRPATSEEIEQANQKFPFEYSTGIPNIVKECSTPDQVEIENDFHSIILTESAWQEIGKRKGWEK